MLSSSDAVAIGKVENEKTFSNLDFYKLIMRSSYNPILNPAIGTYRFIEPDEVGDLHDMERSDHVESAPTEPTTRLYRWDLPGHGTPKTSCGKTRSVTACEDGHLVLSNPCLCHSLSCPVCYPALVRRLSSKIRTDLENFYNLIRMNDCHRGCFQHVVVSFPPEQWDDMYSVECFQKMKKTTQQVIQKVGIVGGVMFTHPFRQDDDDADRTEQINVNLEHWRNGLHFHIIGYGWISSELVKRISEESHVNIKTIRTYRSDEFDLIQGTVSYLLSHVGITSEPSRPDAKSRRTFYSFGLMNSHSLSKIATVTTIKTRLCPACNKQMTDFEPSTGLMLCHCENKPSVVAMRSPVYIFKKDIGELLRKLETSDDLPHTLKYSMLCSSTRAPWDYLDVSGTFSKQLQKIGIIYDKKHIKKQEDEEEI